MCARPRILDEYYYYIVHKPAWCVFELCKRRYRRGQTSSGVLRTTMGVESHTCARVNPQPSPRTLPPSHPWREGCVCVRDRALYFGRSSRRKRVGEISSDNGSSFRCVGGTILLCNMCVRYNIIYRFPSAPHAITVCTRLLRYGRVRVKWNLAATCCAEIEKIARPTGDICSTHYTHTDIEYNIVTTTLRWTFYE